MDTRQQACPNHLGSITAGKDADRAILDGNPLEIASSVRMTIINGEVVWSVE